MTSYAMGDPKIAAVQVLCAQYLRPVDAWVDDGTGKLTALFVPALSAPEQTALADLTTMASFGITSNITLVEFQAIKPDLALGKAFLGIASPTNAQAVAAEKAIIRVLGALLRS